jgi:putative Mg2+ transporter-C (MgtC) family protein
MDFLGSLELETVFRLFLAFFLGLVLGVEREFAGKEAGPRTYSLVALGSAVFTVLSLDPLLAPDNARMVSQIIPGIGFIGAGLIIFHQSRVHGLSTAAGIWMIAAVGIAIGMGNYAVALFAYFLAITSLFVLRKLDIEFKIEKIRNKKKEEKII